MIDIDNRSPRIIHLAPMQPWIDYRGFDTISFLRYNVDYKVSSLVVGSSWSYVTLEGMGQLQFNTIWFDETSDAP